ncbi:piwi-like protein 2 [Panonychus citri]|uniref:piwi-like protein 2 n=1 Tax=Panonychus citri TaxID=50023 RepID=UPI00230825A1|nr:piwi-like protein 2 [Panonychus citri]
MVKGYLDMLRVVTKDDRAQTYRPIPSSQLPNISKLLSQMSVKMGAQACALIISVSFIMNPKDTMIAGYTYRDTVKNDLSVCFVSSTNVEITTWYSTTLLVGLKSLPSINGRFHEKILIYRDGVSKGQIACVYHKTRKVAEVLSEREDLKDIVMV